MRAIGINGDIKVLEYFVMLMNLTDVKFIN